MKAAPWVRLFSFHKFIDGLAQVFNGIQIPGGYRVHHAVAHMVLEDDLAGFVDGGPNGCKLDQDFRAVVAFLHHPLYFFQMADGAGQTVDHGLLIFVDMAVGMGNALGVFFLVAMMIVVVDVVQSRPSFAVF